MIPAMVSGKNGQVVPTTCGGVSPMLNKHRSVMYWIYAGPKRQRHAAPWCYASCQRICKIGKSDKEMLNG